MQKYNIRTAWWSVQDEDYYDVDNPDASPSETSELKPIELDFSPVDLKDVKSATWMMACEMARKCEALGRLEPTESYLLKALKIASGFRVDDPRSLETVSTLADFYFRNGNSAGARKWFLVEAYLAHKIFGGEHERSANALSRLGTFYMFDRSYLAATRCFSRALDVHTMLSGISSGPVKNAAYNLAMVAQIAGNCL